MKKKQLTPCKYNATPYAEITTGQDSDPVKSSAPSQNLLL
jgi:hypothetical protein